MLYIRSALASVKRMYGLFARYVSGSEYDFYDPAATYPIGYRVKWYFGVYEAIVDGITGISPNSDTNWVKVLDSHIGATERSLYNSNRIMYEYALNRIFSANFRQYIDTVYTPYSDIYIDTVTVVQTTFLVGETIGDYIGESGSDTYVTETEIYASSSTYQFTIHVPTSLYNALGATSDIREKAFRYYADKFKPSGTTYTIQTY